MTNGSLDAGIKAFIQSCINSAEQLEILLLLRVKGELDAETINRELRASPTSVSKRLADLACKNLIAIREQDGRSIYYYDPPGRFLDTIDRLAALYVTHKVAIINMIFSTPPAMLKDFSDAFRLRDKEKGK